MQLGKKSKISPWKYLRMHFSAVVEYKLQLVLLLLLYTLLCCVFPPTAPDVYAILHCENDTVRTRVFNSEGNPEFNLRAIFYRRYPNTHISIEVLLIPILSLMYITYVHGMLTQSVCVFAVCRYGAEVCCGTRCLARLDSRRRSLRGVGATWLICGAADPTQDADGASTSRRPPASVSQTCEMSCLGNHRPLRWTMMSKQLMN